MMLKAIYYVLNLRLIIILIETILVLQLYKTYDIKIEIDLTVLSVAIVFPLVFSITSAYQRRQDSIRHYTGFRNKIIDLTNLIYSVDNIDKEEYNLLFQKLLTLQKSINSILLSDVNQLDQSKEYRKLRKNIFSQIIKIKNKFNEREKDSIIRVKNELFFDVEMLNGIRIHGTPISLRVYCLIFIFISPFLFSSNQFFISESFNSELFSTIISLTISFILMALYNVQEYIENPFDQKGLDDLKINSLQVEENERLEF
jgi:predicted membrane chloride channel (bestrophin family)